MTPFVDEIRICTNEKWFDVVSDLIPEATVLLVRPSTMNRAVMEIHGSQNLIGMPDTFFTDGNPYEDLASGQSVAVALWECGAELRGKVGQVDYAPPVIRDVLDKDPECQYPLMWGALRMDWDAISYLDPEHPHPGIDLLRIVSNKPYSVHLQRGRYIDCGTPQGLKEMLNSERINRGDY